MGFCYVCLPETVDPRWPSSSSARRAPVRASAVISSRFTLTAGRR